VTAPAHRVRRLEPAALAGVMSRDIVLFGRYWKATTFSSVVQPTIYLLAFGLGFGSLVSHVEHVRYVEYVGTGVVATAVLFSSAFPGMFNTFIRWKFQRTYDAMLAAPVDVEELITAEVLWISVRAGVYGVAPLIVAMAFGLSPSPGMLLVPFVGFVTGIGFASFGVLVAAIAKTIDNFN
jgi:lipooligosaccharide transport system permease protein